MATKHKKSISEWLIGLRKLIGLIVVAGLGLVFFLIGNRIGGLEAGYKLLGYYTPFGGALYGIFCGANTATKFANNGKK